MWGSLRVMALGLFIFGLGVSPVSVVQETIIVRFFKTHGLGVTMAMGLFAGKAASFLAARTAYPLSGHFGPRAPFYVSTALAAFSVIVNLIYISLSRRLVDLAGAELEAADISSGARRRFSVDISEDRALEEVAKKRHVHMRQIVRFGDVFWA
jgi:MFS family permease